MDLEQFYTEVVKTASAQPAVDEHDKIAAVMAIQDRFDADGIEYDTDEEKLASAIAIVDGYLAQD